MSQLILPPAEADPSASATVHPTTQASPATIDKLPKLEVTPAAIFTKTFDPTAEDYGEKVAGHNNVLGRHVIIELLAPAGADRTHRQRLWQKHQGMVNFERLGTAAKALELANINWRQARNIRQVLEWADALPSTLPEEVN